MSIQDMQNDGGRFDMDEALQRLYGLRDNIVADLLTKTKESGGVVGNGASSRRLIQQVGVVCE